MTFFDAETWKVKAVALLGFTTPGINLVLKNLEPILNFLILMGQVGITTLTVLYLYRKWKNLPVRRNRKPKTKNEK